MKKIMTVLLLCVMLVSVFCGCGSGDSEQKGESTSAVPSGSEQENKPERVVFSPSLDKTRSASFTIIGDLNNFEAMEEVINAFNVYYPNVRIEYEKVDNYSKTVDIRLKNDPSVGCFIGSLSNSSLAVDLMEYGVNTKAFGYIIKSNIAEGHLYGIPMGVNISGLVVNTTLLSKLGLSVPKNYDEFTSVCDQLVEKGYTPIQQQHAATCRYLFEPYVWSRIVESEDIDQTVSVLSSGEKGSMEIMRPVFDLYDLFVEKHYIDPEINGQIQDGYDKAILNFFEGDVAFMPAIGDTVSGMKKRESKSDAFGKNPFEYQFIYAPLSKDGVYAEQQVWKSLCISKYCDNRDIVVEFIKFVASTDTLNLLAKTKGIPTASAISDDERFTFLSDAKGLYIYLWEYDIPHAAWNSVIGRLIEYASGMIETPDEALALVEQDNRTE